MQKEKRRHPTNPNLAFIDFVSNDRPTPINNPLVQQPLGLRDKQQSIQRQVLEATQRYLQLEMDDYLRFAGEVAAKHGVSLRRYLLNGTVTTVDVEARSLRDAVDRFPGDLTPELFRAFIEHLETNHEDGASFRKALESGGGGSVGRKKDADPIKARIGMQLIGASSANGTAPNVTDANVFGNVADQQYVYDLLEQVSLGTVQTYMTPESRGRAFFEPSFLAMVDNALHLVVNASQLPRRKVTLRRILASPEVRHEFASLVALQLRATPGELLYPGAMRVSGNQRGGRNAITGFNMSSGAMRQKQNTMSLRAATRFFENVRLAENPEQKELYDRLQKMKQSGALEINDATPTERRAFDRLSEFRTQASWQLDDEEDELRLGNIHSLVERTRQLKRRTAHNRSPQLQTTLNNLQDELRSEITKVQEAFENKQLDVVWDSILAHLPTYYLLFPSGVIAQQQNPMRVCVEFITRWWSQPPQDISAIREWAEHLEAIIATQQQQRQVDNDVVQFLYDLVKHLQERYRFAGEKSRVHGQLVEFNTKRRPKRVLRHSAPSISQRKKRIRCSRSIADLIPPQPY